ncbi:MAG: V-type ATP synthase subunit C [Clostridia bacterium]|nr:V-type ATP synthase subunit C [Clostridia bacterium]
MAGKTITDKDYLFLSAMLKARETQILTREKMDRMLSAESFAEAAKLLVDGGYEDMSGADAGGIDAALSQHRKEIFDEIYRLVPEKALVDVFRLKYDYHNAKVLIKAEGAGTSGEHIFSDSGRVNLRTLKDAYHEDDFRFVPLLLGKAMAEAKSVLARTGNPQLADFVVDKAYFAEMLTMAETLDSKFITAYTKLLIDNANLRSVVRTMRMGRDQEFMLNAMSQGGGVGAERLAQSVMSGDGIVGVFAATPLKEAAILGAEAMKGGSMTKFELACDNAITAFLSTVKLVSFGQEPVAEYLAMKEAEITAIRMILTGKLAGIAPDVIRERLRDINA